MKTTTSSSWQQIERFYEELIDKYQWQQQPMLMLVRSLIERGFSRKYWPLTSHAALGVSTVEKYEDLCQNRVVFVSYDDKTDSFAISFQAVIGDTVTEKHCSRAITEQQIEEIEEWLSNAI